MKKNHISILSLKIILFFWGYVYLSTIPINGQTIYYPQTRLLFEHEVGCQTFIEEDVYLTVMESRGKCIKVCQGSEVTYTVEGMPGSSFEWVVIGGSVQNNSSNSFTITWGQGGEGQISITETTVSQISESYLVCIEMIEQPKALFTVQPYSIGTNLYVCKNEEVTFTDLSESDASDILYWAWDFGDETTSAERNPTHHWDREGDFKVILTVTNKCNCSNSFLIEVHVREGAPILIECPSVVCEGVKAVYSIPEGSCKYYIWEVRGGTVDPIQNKNHTAIVWDRPKDLINGFGYLHLFNEFCPNTCQKYSTIKVPVITTTAHIKGEQSVCNGFQYIYSLPEWPATLFNWQATTLSGNATIDSVGPLRGKDIILTFSGKGTIRLTVNYINTIQECGGFAEKIIEVRPPTTIAWSEKDFCIGEEETFVWKENETPINGTWQLQNPDGSSHANQLGSSYVHTFEEEGFYTLSVSGNYCKPDDLIIQVKKSPIASGEITGNTVVCLGMPEEYSAVESIPETFFEWEIEGGVLASTSGEIVSATWTNNSGTIKLYRVSNQSPFCRTLVQTLNVNQFDPNNLTIAASGSNNYHPHCEQHFFTTYNGENYLKGEDYNWSIIPNSVGSVVENNHQYNAVVVLNHTTDTLYDQQLQLKIKKCGVEHVKIKTFDVFYIPVPFMFAIDDHFCEGVPKTIALTNFNLFDSLFYFYEEGKYPINGPNFTCSFNNTTHDITFGDITAVGYVCGAAYINLRNSWTIYPKPDIKITPNNQISYCHNEPHNIPLIITSPDRITHYQWYRNEEIIPGATDSIYIPEVEGSYYMIATGFFNCLSKSNAVRVTIDSCSGQEPDYTVVCDFSVSTTVSCNMISAEISPPDFDDLYFAEGSSSGGEITLISSTGNHGEYRVTDPGQYYISGGVSNENPACESRFRKLVTVPVIPSCAVSFSCDSNRSLTYCLNTSKALPNFPIDYQLILDGIPIDTIYRFLVPGSTHTLQVTSNYNNQICSSEVVTFTVPTISADFAVNRSPVCQDVPVTLTPLETENIILYYWKFGNDGIFKLKEATCTYQDPISHEVTLIVIDQYGCVDSSHYSIDVRPNNLSGIIQPYYAMTVCQGSPIVLTCHPAGENPITYLWDDLQDTSASVHVNHSGIYHVTLTDDLSCHTVVSSQNVTVIPFPQVHITGTTNVCEHDRIDLSGYCGSGYRYSWSQIEPELIENISSTYRLQLDHAQPGHYLFQLTVSPAQNSSCSHTDTISVNVTPLPNPPYISLTSMSCHPYSAQLDLSPIDSNGIYRWSNGKSGSTIHVDHGGPYCVYYTNQNGCTVQSPDISVPHSPEYYFWTFPTGCYYFCTENLPVTVYGPVWFPIVEQWRWKWMRNGNFINGGSTPSYNENGLEPPLRIPKGGVYQLSLANEFCDEITGNMNVTEVDCKKCNIQLTSEQQYEYSEEDKSVTLNITIEHPYTTDWNYSIQSLSGYPVLPSSGILYNHTINQLIFKLLIEEHSEFPFSETIELIMWNPFDETMRCTYIFKFTVTADHIILQPKKHTILPKETEEEDYFYLYPNPANTHCTLAYRFTEEGDYTIFIRDLLGKELLKRKIPEQSGHILVDLSPYNRGLYFIECRQDNQLKKMLKIVKN